MEFLLRLFCFVGLLFTFYAWLCAHRTFRYGFREPRKRPITILKPMTDIFESGMVYNLTSFAHLDWYPGDELIFCFPKKDPAAHEFLLHYKKLHPSVPVKISFGAVDTGVNPKVQNIFHAYNTVAENELILISDSNVHVPPNYLNVADADFNCKTNILTAAILPSAPGLQLWSNVEAMTLHRFYNKWLLVLNSLELHSIVMGKSMMFRKWQLDRHGGLRGVSDYLAEDYSIGQRLGRAKVMSVPVRQLIMDRKFSGMADRFVRWGRMRKAHAPIVFAIELFSSLSVMSLFATLSMPWWTSMLYSTVWCWFEAGMIRKIGGKPKLIPFMISEWLTIPLWILTAIGNKVVWAGNTFEMQHGGKCVKSLS